MKQQLEQALTTAVKSYLASTNLDSIEIPAIELEYARDPSHGDFASNVAMVLAKPVSNAPRKIAEGIIECLPAVPYLEKTEIAGPGFINFYLSREAHFQVITDILEAGDDYGKSDHGRNSKVLLEYVSSNPTGPIHIGHGRGAAYGSVLAKLMTAAGYNVTREYYVNDAGRQMDILTISVWLRYLAIILEYDVPFPANGYHGQYVADIARDLYNAEKKLPLPDMDELHAIINGHSEEDHKLDLIIALAKHTLNAVQYLKIFDFTLELILGEIQDDLEDFGVSFDNWFSERSLIENHEVAHCISQLETSGDIYEKDGARWFRSSRYGDEKDRVVIRENGQATYFASDIAYHVNKYSRGYDEIINIWGADHHGYISRVKGALQAMGQDPEKLRILLVQFATLYRGEEKMQMSTRSGEYVTLKHLRDEVGNNATRFFYVMRKSEQHLDFDLELAKSESNANPVYYVQYAYARICSVFRQLPERGLTFTPRADGIDYTRLEATQELELAKSLARYGEVLLSSATSFEPHQLSFYLRELANDFHAYYNSCQFLVDDVELRQARLSLIAATRQVIANGLDLLGVTAPEEM